MHRNSLLNCIIMNLQLLLASPNKMKLLKKSNVTSFSLFPELLVVTIHFTVIKKE